MKENPLTLSLFRPIAFFFFDLLFWVVKVLPYGAYRFLVRGAIGVYYSIAKKLRRNAIESLTIAFGDNLSLSDKQKISWKSFFHLAEGIAGFIYGIQHPCFTQKTFILEGREHLDNALSHGKGAILSIAHFGPFAWMLLSFIQQGYKTNVVMRPPRSPLWHEKFRIAYKWFKLNLIYSIPLRSCVTECFKALERGELLFMPVDQNYGAAGRVFVDFFGRKAATASGPVVYALKTGAPILTAFALPEKDGRFKIVIEPAMAVVRQETEKETVVYNIGVITARVEDYARKYPEQWSWMHRRWKTVPREGEI